MKAKDLFSFLLLVPFLILAGCGGGTGSDSAALPAGVTLVSIAVTPGNPSIPVRKYTGGGKLLSCPNGNARIGGCYSNGDKCNPRR